MSHFSGLVVLTVEIKIKDLHYCHMMGTRNVGELCVMLTGLVDIKLRRALRNVNLHLGPIIQN